MNGGTCKYLSSSVSVDLSQRFTKIYKQSEYVGTDIERGILENKVWWQALITARLISNSSLVLSDDQLILLFPPLSSE